MATDTVPAAVPGPPETPPTTTANGPASTGFLAAMVAPVEPARPTTPAFDITPTNGTEGHPAAADGALDRSTPGVSSGDFGSATDQASDRGGDAAGARHKRSVWKELWLAAATRWAKGGGTANKRLELQKAMVQAKAHQVKENRTTNMVRSGGLPVRDTGGSGAGTRKGNDKPSGNSGGKGPANSSGNRSTGGGGRGGAGNSGGAGGGRGTHGGSGHPGGRSSDRNNGNGNGGGRGSRDTSTHGPRAASDKAKHTGPDKTAGKDKGGRNTGTHGGSQGGTGKNGGTGANGKDGASGKSGGTGKDSKAAGPGPNLTKNAKDRKSGKGADGQGAPGGRGSNKQANGQADTRATAGQQHGPAADKPSLQKSRETGHGDGSKVRRVVDHVIAYTDGARDGWDDEKAKNAKEHDRLDKAHDQRAAQPDLTAPKADSTTGDKTTDKDGPKADDKTKTGRPQLVIVTEQEDDGVSTDVKPLTVNTVNTSTLTLGTQGARDSIGRKELRNYCQYQTKLQTKETVLGKIREACKQLQTEAEAEAKDCQNLAEQAKTVEGGAKLVAQLNKLADAAKNQAAEAAELAKRAQRAAEMCKVVLTNIQTRYQPLYQAVVDSDETKPAEMRFYNDKGYYATAA